MRGLRTIAAGATALESLACVPGPPVEHGAQRIEVPAQPPAAGESAAPAREVPEEPFVRLEADVGDAGVARLPTSWAEFGDRRPFAEAAASARAARTAFESAARSMPSPADGGAPVAPRFERASAMLEQASRRFAAAYHAADATPEDRIATLREGAAMILAWALRLDEAGLALLPAAYRTSTTVALTFEDVASGPAKRWREEGLTLVRVCVDRARADRVESRAAEDCRALQHNYARVLPRGGARDGGTACACDPGDPLCSASMSGWCRPAP